MTPVLLAALVAVASFFTISTIVALAVSSWWRARQPVALDANRLFSLRLLPTAAGALVTVWLVTPAFVRFEPPQEAEQPGPVLVLLGAAGLFVLFAGARRILGALLLTRRLRRRWLASASALPALDDEIPTHLVDVPYPVVAIVGIVRPVLVVSRTVTGGCSADEVRLIAAHERAHLRAGDNLKRLIIDGCPDVMCWTRTGREIAAAWSASAEDAADDIATGSDRRARLALAGVLLRVARMAVDGAPAPALASALVGLSGVERRVRRLAESGPLPSASRAGVYVAGAVAAGALASAASNHRLLETTYVAAEFIVALGR